MGGERQETKAEGSTSHRREGRRRGWGDERSLEPTVRLTGKSTVRMNELEEERLETRETQELSEGCTRLRRGWRGSCR